MNVYVYIWAVYLLRIRSFNAVLAKYKWPEESRQHRTPAPVLSKWLILFLALNVHTQSQTLWKPHTSHFISHLKMKNGVSSITVFRGFSLQCFNSHNHLRVCDAAPEILLLTAPSSPWLSRSLESHLYINVSVRVSNPKNGWWWLFF